MDMYDHPDELLKLIDVVTDFAIKDTIAGCSGKATPFVWYWLHKGVDEFMSDEQFKKFYWPSLLKYINAVAGCRPYTGIVCGRRVQQPAGILKGSAAGQMHLLF